MHTRQVLHRDLKSQNVFLNRDGDIKIGDFGIARILSSPTELAQTQIGTPYYMSPELIRSEPYGMASDVWSLGCLCYEIAAGRIPWTGTSMPELLREILSGEIPALPAVYSPALQHLVESMLALDPEARPTLDDILGMPFLAETVERCVGVVGRLQRKSSRVPTTGTGSGRLSGSGGSRGGRPRGCGENYQHHEHEYHEHHDGHGHGHHDEEDEEAVNDEELRALWSELAQVYQGIAEIRHMR